MSLLLDFPHHHLEVLEVHLLAAHWQVKSIVSHHQGHHPTLIHHRS
jgi:hypothetical protein